MHNNVTRLRTLVVFIYPGGTHLDVQVPGRAQQVEDLRGQGSLLSEEAFTVSAGGSWEILHLQEQGAQVGAQGEKGRKGLGPPNHGAGHTLTVPSPPGGPCWRRKEATCVGPRPFLLLAVAPLSLVGGSLLAMQKAA